MLYLYWTYDVLFMVSVIVSLERIVSEYFHILQSAYVTLEFDEPVAWTLDGEYGGETTKADIININKPVRIMVPGQE